MKERFITNGRVHPTGGIAKKGERTVGRVTSGTKSPTLNKAIALGYVSSEESRVDNVIDVEIRSRRVPTKIVPIPFYRRNGVAKQVEGGQ